VSRFQAIIPLRWHLHLITAVHHVPWDPLMMYTLVISSLRGRATSKILIHCDSHSRVHRLCTSFTIFFITIVTIRIV